MTPESTDDAEADRPDQDADDIPEAADTFTLTLEAFDLIVKDLYADDDVYEFRRLLHQAHPE